MPVVDVVDVTLALVTVGDVVAVVVEFIPTQT